MLYAGWSMPLFSCDLFQQVDCPDFEVAGGFARRFPSWFIVLHFLGAPTHTFEISWRFMTSRGLFFEHIQKHTWRKTLMHVCRLFIQKGWNQQIRNSGFQTSAKKQTQKTRKSVLSISHHKTTTPSFKKPRNKKPPKTAQETQVAMPMVSKKSTTAKSQSYILRQVLKTLKKCPGFGRSPKFFERGKFDGYFFWNNGWKSCRSIGMKTNMWKILKHVVSIR